MNKEKIHVRKYLSNLSQKDFQKVLFNGKEIYFHTFRASIPSLAFLGECSFVVIQTQKGNLSQKTFRILFTNVSNISTLQFLTIYKRRWLQETYHQILKDSFGLKSSKHRRLVAFFRLIELGNLAYCFLESQRLKSSCFVDSLSSIRQALLLNQSAVVSLKHNLAAA
ncbi:MAG: transposase [Acidobacteria bacterium]|nr:transposase [Acidobacteriota bacterium]